MTENEKKAKILANYLGIENGVIVNSGTIAILSALKLANIKQGDNVLINGYCCYSLFEAIMNIGATPIIVIPKNFFNISIQELEKIIINRNIKCFIATHQYGIVQDIKEIKNKFPNLIIIEDIAQGWNIKENNLGIGRYSDFIVTSFGKSKALSYGQAGAVFSNQNIREYFDFHDKESRKSCRFLLPFVLYDCQNIDTKVLLNEANDVIKKQRLVAYYLTKYFDDNDNVIIYKDKNGQKSSWHKFPVIIKNKEYQETFEKIMNDYEIIFQWQNEKEVWELDMVKNYNCEIIYNSEKPIYALIKTKQNEIEKIKKLVRSKK